MFPKKPFQKEKIQMQRRIKAYHPKTNPKKRKNVGAKDKGLPEKHFSDLPFPSASFTQPLATDQR